MGAGAWPWATAITALLLITRAAVAADEVRNKPQYSYGDAIPVSCLNRHTDTGEHMTNDKGELQYSPFPTCSETGRPLELYFGVEKDMNCTIDFIDDPLFHLLEFYIHNDAPMTCRIPHRPLAASSPSLNAASFADSEQVGALGSQSSAYIPLVVALSGTLQLSHLHVANNLNVLLHAAPRKTAPGVIDAATAYSVNTAIRNTKIVIGDSLSLRLSVRWYPNSVLPSGWTGVGGHLTATTVLYCLLSAAAAASVAMVYFRGFELPRRLRTHGRDRTGLARADSTRMSAGGGGYGFAAGGGGVGNGWGYAGQTGGQGKVD